MSLHPLLKKQVGDARQDGGHLDLRGFSFDGKPMGDLVSDWNLEKDGLAARFPMIDATKNGSRYRAEDLVLDFSDDRLLVTTNDRVASIDTKALTQRAERTLGKLDSTLDALQPQEEASPQVR